MSQQAWLEFYLVKSMSTQEMILKHTTCVWLLAAEEDNVFPKKKSIYICMTVSIPILLSGSVLRMDQMVNLEEKLMKLESWRFREGIFVKKLRI